MMKPLPILLFVAALFACTRDTPAPAEAAEPASGKPTPAEAEDPLVVRFRTDLLRLEPSASPEKLEKAVAKFALRVKQARQEPYPASHAACLAIMKGRATDNCIMAPGDVLAPKWFEACKKNGGAVLDTKTPPDTPMFYDRQICTQIFSVGG